MYCIEPLAKQTLHGFNSRPSKHYFREECIECPTTIVNILEKRGWCQTEYGWSHEKIAPVYVTWKDAFNAICP